MFVGRQNVAGRLRVLARRIAAVSLLPLLTCTAGAAEPLDLTISWDQNILSIRGNELPGESLEVWYMEAYCRAGSTNRNWAETKLRHTTRMISHSDDGKKLQLRCTLEDGVVCEHSIRVVEDGVEFTVVARNPTDAPSQAQWAQPCIRVDRFTGCDQETYLPKCFLFVDGKLQRMPTRPWATEALYVPGQVWCPAHVDRDDVNPRPLSELVPSKGLIGCFSGDDRMLMAVAWEPYQELFQGVITCIHSDFRIGGLDPGQSKSIRGRIYLLPANEQELAKRYAADFPEHDSAR